MCPFLNEKCIKEKCKLWDKNNCAINRIAGDLEYLYDIKTYLEDISEK